MEGELSRVVLASCSGRAAEHATQCAPSKLAPSGYSYCSPSEVKTLLSEALLRSLRV